MLLSHSKVFYDMLIMVFGGQRDQGLSNDALVSSVLQGPTLVLDLCGF